MFTTFFETILILFTVQSTLYELMDDMANNELEPGFLHSDWFTLRPPDGDWTDTLRRWKKHREL